MESHEHLMPLEDDRWPPQISVLWWLCVVLISTHFAFDYLKNNFWFLNMQTYAAGSAASPFQQRVLMAWVIRAVEHFGVFRHFPTNVPPLMHDAPGMCVFFVSLFSMFGAILCTAGTIRALTGNLVFSRWAGLLVCYMAYFPLCLAYAADFILPYDVPSLFFLSLCLFCIVRNMPWLYLAAFALATTNRETICMATIFFAGWYFFRPIRSRAFVGIHVAVQIVLWVAIRTLIHRHYPGVGSEVEPILKRTLYNVRVIVNPLQWPVLLSLFGYSWAVLLVWRRYIQDRFLVFGLAVTGGWMVILFGTGVYNEIRIFAELSSFISVAVGVTIWNRLAAARRAVAETAVRTHSQSLNQAAEGRTRAVSA